MTEQDTAPSTPGRVRHRALGLIELYQRAFAGRPSPCRFFPSCSTYAHDAITVHGTARGGWLTLRRLLRCRPFGPSGFDPVPDACSPRCRHGVVETAAVPATEPAVEPTAEKGS